ncbi:hypothetical protein [Cognatishimia sp. F0-27]|uniref:hypothetical protein n=1 Tax=Cognatishimia sp. F0-27 TaxID=2816855 RepID=UPI001D0CA618|nr:hypothetical protein [Cognatishimia sp. F0-27]MCC1491681.1 hypothetical protein [Cognatishimia sp. F0-27]
MNGAEDADARRAQAPTTPPRPASQAHPIEAPDIHTRLSPALQRFDAWVERRLTAFSFSRLASRSLWRHAPAIVVALGIGFSVRMDNARLDQADPDAYGPSDHVITEIHTLAELVGIRLPARQTPEPLPPRNYRIDRLTLREKAQLSERLDSALREGDGWRLYRSRRSDSVALRPDMAECLRMAYYDCYLQAKPNLGWVYVRAGHRIGVHVHYERKIGERDDWIQSPRNRWSVIAPRYSEPAYPKSNWRKIGRWHGFDVQGIPVDNGASYFLRLTAARDGAVTLSVLTDAPLHDVRAWLSTLDLAFLKAMIARPARWRRPAASGG